MKSTQAELAEQLSVEAFPRSASYDPEWMLENAMGPNPIWLAEALSQKMDLQPGSRVLDLGCGRAITSIFLAQEFHLQVWATDLWISARDNWQRICAAKAEFSQPAMVALPLGKDRAGRSRVSRYHSRRLEILAQVVGSMRRTRLPFLTGGNGHSPSGRRTPTRLHSYRRSQEIMVFVR
jgi:SAM-dependent methyltransferase